MLQEVAAHAACASLSYALFRVKVALMTTLAKATDLSRFCSLCARQAGLDAVGSAYTYEHVLAVETPLPWPVSMYSQPGVLPDELLQLRKRQVEAYQRGESMQVSAFAIAPDATYSMPGYRRVLSYRRPQGLFARFTQAEYLVPQCDVGPLCWALLIDHAALPRFADHLLPSSGVRDLMVCTHGAVDAACAKFGFPLYRELRRMADESEGRLRTWRVSHFGGHVFAPTMIDMPEFRYWAYIEREQAELLVARAGHALHLRDNYRGWAGLDSPFLQAAERELFVRHGWPWIDYRKSGRVLAQSDADDQLTWADVRIDYAAPDGSDQGAYLVRVELQSSVDCRHSSADNETFAYPQYGVTQVEMTCLDKVIG